MLTFWQWVKHNNPWKQLSEAVEQQRERITSVLQKMFPSLPPESIQRLLATIIDNEKKLTDPEDIRKSATVTKFLKTYKVNPQESAAHTLDRFQREINIAIERANSKGKTPEQMLDLRRQELQRLLPDEPEEVIESLLSQVKSGARPEDVANRYLASKKSLGSNSVVYREGNLEMIAITSWEGDDRTEKHLDTHEPEACHVLLRGTSWCVRFRNYFDRYTSSGPLYLVRQNGKPLILGHKNSPWLNTEDEPPELDMMHTLAPFVMRSGVKDVAPQAAYFLPNFIQDLESVLMKYDADTVAEIQKNIVGETYFYNKNQKRIEIEQYRSILDCLDGLRNYQNNEIGIDLEDAENTISENIPRITDEELIEELFNENYNKINDLLEQRYEDGYFGEIEGWEDIEFEEAIKLDDEIMETLRSAMVEACTESTVADLYESIESDLREGDETGFKIDTEKWVMYVNIQDVNDYVLELDHHESYEPMTDKMRFKINSRDISIHCSTQYYNKKIKEALEGME